MHCHIVDRDNAIQSSHLGSKPVKVIEGINSWINQKYIPATGVALGYLFGVLAILKRDELHTGKR